VTGDTSQIPEVSDLVAANQTGTVQSVYLLPTNKTNRAVTTNELVQWDPFEPRKSQGPTSVADYLSLHHGFN